MTSEYKTKLEEAVEILKKNEFGMWSGEESDAERVLLALAKDRLSGNLIEPMSEEEIYEIIGRVFLSRPSWDDYAVLQALQAKALFGHIAKQPIGREELIKIIIEDIPHKYQKRLLEELL